MVAFARSVQQLGEDLQKKTDEVRSRMDQTRAVLPREIDEPTVTRVELDSQPILTYAVEAPAMSDAQVLAIAREIETVLARTTA